MWAGSQAPQGLIGAAEELFGAADFDPPNLKFFPQSVASGDPAPEGVVLWTRALPAPKDRGGSVRVGYRIALDDERSDTDAFLSPVLSGVAQTSRGRDFTVKVQVQDAKLRPGTKYRYRFYVDGKRSRSGRFKTLPEPGADVAGARFGYISCQDYTNGYYMALYHLEREGRPGLCSPPRELHLRDGELRQLPGRRPGGAPDRPRQARQRHQRRGRHPRRLPLPIQKVQVRPEPAGAAREVRVHHHLGRPRVRQRRLPELRPGLGGQPERGRHRAAVGGQPGVDGVHPRRRPAQRQQGAAG